VQERFGAHRMFWGVCALLIFWISRLVLVANRGNMDDDPLIWAIRDPVSRATVGGGGASDRLAVFCDRRTLIFRYVGFAVLAVAANLATQRLVLFGADVVDGARFAAALAAGTLVGSS
jgi:hypothetical protein